MCLKLNIMPFIRQNPLILTGVVILAGIAISFVTKLIVSSCSLCLCKLSLKDSSLDFDLVSPSV